MLPYQLEHLCSYTAQLTPPEVIGPLPEGIRINFYVTGGSATGPRLKGTLRAAGGDWLTLRSDGVGAMDVRATVETPEGALIYIAYTGVAELGADGYARFLANDPPATFSLRTAPRLSSAHPDYLWLNRLQCVGIGQADLARLEVRYDLYALR